MKTGGKNIANSIVDTGEALIEDPIGTIGDMAYNATIGTVEEVIDTTVWGTKMAFDVGDTREKFEESVNAAGGTSQFIGQQSAMIAGGLALRRVGVKNSPKLPGESASSNKVKKMEGTQNNIRQIKDTNGLRNELPLTESQIKNLTDYAEKIGMPKENIRIAGANDTSPTGLIFDTVLKINNDVFPSSATGKLSANSRIWSCQQKCSLKTPLIQKSRY
ncbi:hypothetical protein [Paenibacillus lemnae]|uniref:hypothetical protein n=1 Tax=Paenibacillus lemnae TaxID=1330551 RepID=UPI001FEA03E2|nr:hypothetical protein [Paenibacillus lemnae]